MEETWGSGRCSSWHIWQCYTKTRRPSGDCNSGKIQPAYS